MKKQTSKLSKTNIAFSQTDDRHKQSAQNKSNATEKRANNLTPCNYANFITILQKRSFLLTTQIKNIFDITLP